MSAPSPEVERFLTKLDGVHRSGEGWGAMCPCRNDDNSPSLTINEGDDGRVLVKCHRGEPCDVPTIAQAVGLTMRDLHPNPPPDKDPSPSPSQAGRRDDGKVVARYPYLDADGELVLQVLRIAYPDGSKDFRQRVPDPNKESGWNYSTQHLVNKPLYRLPDVLAKAALGEIVFVVEGEKDVERLEAIGAVATCNPMGADNGRGSKWKPHHTESLAGARVIVIADNDPPGMTHALYVGNQLAAAGIPVRVKVCPEPYKDVSDYLDAGGTITGPGLLTVDHTTVEPAAPTAPESFEEAKAAAATGRVVTWREFWSETADDSYDWVIDGLIERGDRVMVVAAEGVGKALALDTRIPTPTGWTTMGAISVNDAVLDGEGRPCVVTYATGVQMDRECFRVEFSDGATVVADADHLWVTQTLNEREKRRPGQIRTTTEIRDSLISGRSTRALNHAIIVTPPLTLPDAALPIPPYTLGAWLGDGSSDNGAICCEDPEILARINGDGFETRHRPSTPNMYGILGLQVLLREQGLRLNKHIPAVYLRGSFQQRLEMVQGLMDTDGTVDGRGTCEFMVTSEPLARGFHELLHTLGIKATWREGRSTLDGVDHGPKYRLSFRTVLPVFTLPRKLHRLLGELQTPRSSMRYITAVTPVDSVPVRCIQVDSPDSTYLCGEQMIRTHNTTLARQVAILAGAGIHPFSYDRIPPVRTLLVDLENPERLVRRQSRRLQQAINAHLAPNAPIQSTLWLKPSGINLLTVQGQALFEQQLAAHQPELLVMGPIYKAFKDPGGMTSTALISELVTYLDYIRTVYNCALWLEHHAPLGNSLTGREMRPADSAVWMRWPEFGFALRTDPTITGPRREYLWEDWRGMREFRRFPSRLARGTLFPFEVLEYREQDW